jgi:hypothetical protein
VGSETASRTRYSTLDTAPRWYGFAKPRHRPRSPNSATPKCPWAGSRFHNRTRTTKWPTFVSHCSTGCIPMRAEGFGRLYPPNNCSTTRIDPQDRLDQWDQPVQWSRLRPLRPLPLLARLVQDHPVAPLVPADLGGLPPPNWRSSKLFYSLNIQSTWTTTMPFVRVIDIFMCYKKSTFLTLTILTFFITGLQRVYNGFITGLQRVASGRIKPDVVQ